MGEALWLERAGEITNTSSDLRVSESCLALGFSNHPTRFDTGSLPCAVSQSTDGSFCAIIQCVAWMLVTSLGSWNIPKLSYECVPLHGFSLLFLCSCFSHGNREKKRVCFFTSAEQKNRPQALLKPALLENLAVCGREMHITFP